MKILVLFIFMAVVLTAHQSVMARPITKDQAWIVAKNFAAQDCLKLKFNLDSDNLFISEVFTFETNGQPAIYAFSMKSVGFILVSADDALQPILGYSQEGNFSVPGINPNFDGLLSQYIDQVNYIRNNSVSASVDIQNAWNIYLYDQTDFSVHDDTLTVGPLITAMWNQESPYNEFCPLDPAGSGGHVPTGCIATAMSMIMYYYRYPIKGNSQHSYNASGYGIQTANFGSTTYDWSAMQNTINNQSGQGIPANALLQYHAGISVNMAYASSGSGAYSSDVPYALKTYFKYSPSVQQVERGSYSDTEWENMIIEQLNANKPVFYSGKKPSENAGHAWVCDGYQKIGVIKSFHFNFGWGGSGNGYYTLSNPNGYTSQMAIIRNIYPNSNYPYGCSSKTVSLSRGSIEDGSGPIAQYSSNLNCTWLIAPDDSVRNITITFIRFDLHNSDTLFLYDGPDTNSPLLASLSGNTIPAKLTSTGNKIFIRFNTDIQAQGNGWLLEYASVLPNFCSSEKTMTEPTGSFTDGSGPFNYKNNSLCKYKIQPPNARNLTLIFEEFDLLVNDHILVYSLSDSKLIATLTGKQIPAPITVPVDGLFLLFQTDSYNTGSGFKASYTSSGVGISEFPDIRNYIILPNPVSDHFTVRAYNTRHQKIQFRLTNMMGKTIFSEMISVSKGDYEKSFDISYLHAGVYLFISTNSEGEIIRKIIKN